MTLRALSRRSSSPLLLLLFLLFLHSLSVFSDAYTIDPEMKCAVEGNQLSYVIRINVTEENKAKIHAADPDVSSKAYIMTDGKRCEDSTAELVTESGVEKLKIHAPLLKCGSVEVIAMDSHV